MNIPTLETDRLYLRSFTPEDFEAYAAMRADMRFMQFLAAGKPDSKAETWQNMASIQGHWVLRGYGVWAVEHQTSQQLMGFSGLLNPYGWPGLEVCWGLAPEYWGNGYATEAVKAAIQWAFQQPDIDRLISLIHPDNHRSIALAERVGESFCEEIPFLDKTFRVYEIFKDS